MEVIFISSQQIINRSSQIRIGHLDLIIAKNAEGLMSADHVKMRIKLGGKLGDYLVDIPSSNRMMS